MSDKKPVEKVVFNNEIFVLRKEDETYSGRRKIIYVELPFLKIFGEFALLIGLFLGGGALGYKYALGVQLNSLGYTYFGLSMLSIAMLGMIMIYYSGDVYYEKVDDN